MWTREDYIILTKGYGRVSTRNMEYFQPRYGGASTRIMKGFRQGSRELSRVNPTMKKQNLL